MTYLRIAMVLAGLSALACGFGSYPDKDGTYTDQFPSTPLSNQICQEDSDCVATPYRDGSCCPDSCMAQLNVFNKATFERLRAHQNEICADGKFECVKKTCKPLTYDQEARCTDGYCRIERVYPEPSKSKQKAKAGKQKAGKQKAGKRKAGKRKAR